MPQERLIEMVSGYWLAQLVCAFARLGIADHLTKGPRSAAALAEAAGAAPDAMARLLRAAAAFGLLELTAPETYRLTALGGTLRSKAPGSLCDFAIALGAPGHWRAWGALDQAVRCGGPSFNLVFGQDIWSYFAQQPDEAEHFARAVGNLSELAALDVVALARLDGAQLIVDIGGSQGVLLSALLRAQPAARGILFDRPDVLQTAGPVIERGGASNRIQRVAGDFFETLPTGGDIYLLKQVLHDWDDVQCGRILANVRRAAQPGASLLIVEAVLPAPPEPSPAWLMDLNMLVMVGGRERTRAEFQALLQAADFQLERVQPMRGGFYLLEARVPTAP